MNVDPQPDLPVAWVSDKQDLSQLVKGVRPYTGGDEYSISDFFATDEEQQEFVEWVRAERDKERV